MPTLNFGTIRPAPVAEWLNSYFQLPIFSYSGIAWKGASEIVTQFNYTATKNFTLRELPTPPTGVNFCLVIRYRIGLTSYRYKLWAGVGETLNENLYNGEVIKKNFVLEIWTTQLNTNVSLASVINIKTSIRKIPDIYSSLDEYADNAVVEEAASQNIIIPITSLPTSGLVAHFKNENINAVTWVDNIGGFNLVNNAGVPTVVANAKNGYQGLRLNNGSMQGNNPFAALGAVKIGIFAVISKDAFVAGDKIIHISTPTANDIQGIKMGVANDSLTAFMKLVVGDDNLLLPGTNFDVIHFASHLPSQTFSMDVSQQGAVGNVAVGATMGTKLNIGTCSVTFLEILCYNINVLGDPNVGPVYDYLISKFGLGISIPISVNVENKWLSN